MVQLTSPVLSGTSGDGTIGVSDGLTEFRVDTANGEIWIQDVGGGGAIYLEYDEELLGQLLDFVGGVSLGDANADAMAVLHPWENSGGEPFRFGGLSETIGLAHQYRPLLRRPSKLVGPSSSLGQSMPATPLYLPEWNTDCPSIAEAIGYSRLDYLSGRGSAFQNLRNVQGIPSEFVVWKNGRPTVEIDDLRNFFVSIGMTLAELAVKGTSLDLQRVFYNSYNCQQYIAVQVPQPGDVFVGNGGGSNGSAMFCTKRTEMWEISYNGGLTWYPLPVTVTSCVESQI